MPRTFTTHELKTLTVGEYDALSPTDKATYNEALLNMWEGNYFLDGDLDKIGSRRRYEWGQ